MPQNNTVFASNTTVLVPNITVVDPNITVFDPNTTGIFDVKTNKKGITIHIIPLPAISTFHVYLQLGSIFYKLAKTEEKNNVTSFTL